ncbi:hypothetical protein GMA19_04333 [Paenibacillus polymyxa E681]|uniref:acyltransferase family protein n=1 Tax=Paenibacillus polymyxa TaxID=1406 RepID=UPI0001E31B7B|nr:acyltransferase family protein [Paenibacillus polymyxa]ADM72090.1 hypothetical protein PPE_04330 [Paenibacillus polymyxa E681]QNV59116.1 hypothetical protein GE561_04344 [Paenibacillus polymyxa E681]QNV63942.1 hypothetical protein GMA19_04333 [Paenibacillus polymyxa E681]
MQIVKALPTRIKWVDVLKGLAIIFLVFSHLVPHGFKGNEMMDKSFIIGYFYSFHMPLFFFASGFTSNFQKYKFSSFLWSKIKTILLPYTTLYICSLLYFGWMHWMGIVGTLDPMVVIETFLYADGDHLGILNMSLWFLPCLFLAQIISYVVLKISSKISYIYIFWIMLTILGAFLSKLDTHALPWSFGTSINAASLIICGYIFKLNEQYFIEKIRINKPYFAYAAGFLGFLLFLINDKPGMSGNYYGHNYVLFYLSVLASLIFYIYLSKKIESSSLLSYFGKNSLIIFGLHGLILSFWENVNFYEKFSVTTNMYLDGISFVVISTLLVFLSCILFIELFSRFLPFLIGKKFSSGSSNKTATIPSKIV